MCLSSFTVEVAIIPRNSPTSGMRVKTILLLEKLRPCDGSMQTNTESFLNPVSKVHRHKSRLEIKGENTLDFVSSEYLRMTLENEPRTQPDVWRYVYNVLKNNGYWRSEKDSNFWNSLKILRFYNSFARS